MEFNATFIFTVISFIVFVFLMNNILYRPLEKIVDEREKLISDNNRLAEEYNQEAKTLLEQKALEIAKAKADAKNSLDTQLKADYDESSQKIRAEKDKSLSEINEQKQALYDESIRFEGEMNSNIDDYAQLIKDKLLNNDAEVKNG